MDKPAFQGIIPVKTVRNVSNAENFEREQM